MNWLKHDRQCIATVLEPARSFALVDLPTVKDELGVKDTDTSQDSRLNRYILEVSAQIHAFCRRVFPVQTYRNNFINDPCRIGTDALVLSAAPVIDILGVEEGSSALAASSYYLEAGSGIIGRYLHFGHRACWPAYNVVVDFTAGYPTVPPEVEAAAVLLIRLRQGLRGWDGTSTRDPSLRAREGPTYGREEFFGNVMPNTVGGMPAQIAQMLESYVRPVFA